MDVLIATEPKHEWMNEGLCRNDDPEKWFPEHPKLAVRPLEICQQCPVLEQCATHAIHTEPDYGVWAGLPAQEIQRHIAATDRGNIIEVRKTVDRIIEHGTRLLEEHRQIKQRSRENARLRHERHKRKKQQCRS